MGLFSRYDKFGFDKNGYNRDGFNRMGYNKDGFDKDGFDMNGFNKQGINKLTGRDKYGYDAEGYAEDGYNKAGYDRAGYNRDGYNDLGYDKEGFNKDGYTVDGYDRSGYNKAGFDRNGFGRDGFNIEGIDCDGYARDGYNEAGFNRDGYNREGYDADGFDAQGYNRAGFDRRGYDLTGFDKAGFNVAGYNREGYDRSGYDKNGYDKDGYDKAGYSHNGYNREGYDKDGYNKDGYDKWGCDRSGFNKDGYDKDGYDKNGFDKEGFNRRGLNKLGYDREGYDCFGFNTEGLNRDGRNIYGYDKDGYNILGFDAQGFDRDNKTIDGFARDVFDAEGYHIYTGYNIKGYNRDGFNVNGYDAEGYDIEGYHIVTGYNRNNFDREGYNRSGYDREGYDRNGYNRDGYNREGFDKDGYDLNGYDQNGFNKDGFDKRGYDKNGYNRDGDLDPQRITVEGKYDAEDQENLLEEVYFKKCCAQIRGYYKELVKDRIYKKYKPTERRYIDRWGFVQIDMIYPDMSIANAEVKREVDKVLREPYFAHVDYRYNPELYIGKQAVHGWVTDWADQQASYYYQYQIYIGNKEVDLKCVRDISVKDGSYLGYKELYSKVDGNKRDILSVADERLMQIIKANRSNKKVHDIVESIQQNQYNIITNDHNQSVLVLGCAGSGKTMILMHKIRYIKYNDKKIDMSDFVVISPTDVLGRESRELSQLLQIGKVNQYTTGSFYKFSIEQLLKANGIVFDDFSINDNEKTIARYYQKDYLETFLQKVDDVIYNSTKEAKEFLESEYERLIKIEDSYISRLGMGKEYFDETRRIYKEAIKELSNLGQKDLRRLFQRIDSELANSEKLEKYQIIVEFMSQIPDIKKNDDRKEEESIERMFFYTKKIADSMDIDGFISAVINADVEPNSKTEAFMILQCFCDEPYEKETAYKLLNEWDRLSQETIRDYLNHIKREFVRLTYLDSKARLIKKLLENGKIVPNKNEENRDITVDETLVKTFSLYSRMQNIFGDEIENMLSFFDSYERVYKKRTRVSAQRGINRRYQYIFDAVKSMLNIEDRDDMGADISVSEAFVITYVLARKFGALEKNRKKYIYIDEFQDFAPIELKLIKYLYKNCVINLFGDTNQCINEKGIKDITSIPKVLYDRTPFEIKENYRNAIEITQYVKNKLRIEMLPVGLNGSMSEEDVLTRFAISSDDRVALIATDEEGYAGISGEHISNYMECREIRRGCINVIPVQMVKGLEFEKVIVVGNDFSENEFYVACTRAIEELVVCKSFGPSDLSNLQIVIK